MNQINIPGVYTLYHLPTGQFYIGSSKNVASRLARHKYELKNEIHYNLDLQTLYTRWGDFEITVLPVHDKATAVLCEQILLDHFLGDPACVNKRRALR